MSESRNPESPATPTHDGETPRPTAAERRWAKIDEVLEFALAAPPERREAFLKAACRGDEELRAEVESLLAHVVAGEGLMANLSAALSGQESGTAGAAVRAEWVGRTVGRYRLDESLGGGMAAVYRAWDTLADAPVVLKLTAPGLDGPELVQARMRLEREAFTDTKLEHPCVCRVFDNGTTPEGRGFIVLEFCEGETLRALLKEGPLDVALTVGVVRQVASALSAAHAVGLVHRDVKPSNVMVDEGGAVKLLDFGVAKVEGQRLTRTGQVLGTLEYMSPEQVAARTVGSATDIWSLGLLAYEAMTGQHPYRRASRRETIHAIAADEPVVLTYEGEIPERFTRTIEQMLDRDPDGRPTAAAVERALAAL